MGEFEFQSGHMDVRRGEFCLYLMLMKQESVRGKGNEAVLQRQQLKVVPIRSEMLPRQL